MDILYIMTCFVVGLSPPDSGRLKVDFWRTQSKVCFKFVSTLGWVLVGFFLLADSGGLQNMQRGAFSIKFFVFFSSFVRFKNLDVLFVKCSFHQNF